MDIVSFVNLISDVGFVVFAGILVAAVGLFFFDRPARKASVESAVDQHELKRHAA